MKKDHQVVWIVGASSGIGKALAQEMASQGHSIVLSARNQAALKSVALTLTNATNNSKHLVLPLDLEIPTQFEPAFKQAIDYFGKIDMLVLCGGVSQRAFAEASPMELDRKIMEINYFGTIGLTKTILPYFIQRKQGHFVVISSISGKFGFFLRSAYSASKHALHGFFESLRLEVYQHNIDVTLICPGKIKTDISKHALKGDLQPGLIMDEAQEKGMNVDQCAKEISQAIVRKEKERIIGGKETLGVYIQRFAPTLLFRILSKQKIE